MPPLFFFCGLYGQTGLFLNFLLVFTFCLPSFLFQHLLRQCCAGEVLKLDLWERKKEHSFVAFSSFQGETAFIMINFKLPRRCPLLCNTSDNVAVSLALMGAAAALTVPGWF